MRIRKKANNVFFLSVQYLGLVFLDIIRVRHQRPILDNFGMRKTSISDARCNETVGRTQDSSELVTKGGRKEVRLLQRCFCT